MHLNELDIKTLGRLTDEEFLYLCRDNPHLRMERNRKGNIEIMAPTSSETGFFNLNIATELAIWNRQTKRGYVFDSSTGFTLPNTSIRSPDVSFILKDKWEALSTLERNRFARICPDFVIEIVSGSDEFRHVQNKMNEWMSQGTTLGWLIDFQSKETLIYNNQQVSPHPFEKLLVGSGPISGFQVSLPGMLEV